MTISTAVWEETLPRHLDQLRMAFHIYQDPQAVRQALARLRALSTPDGQDPLEAACVALAACLPPGVSVRERLDGLGWLAELGDALDGVDHRTPRQRLASGRRRGAKGRWAS